MVLTTANIELYSNPYRSDPRAVQRTRLTQQELDEIMALHGRFLKQDSGGKRASLKLTNLSYLDFSGRDLRGADFTGSELKGARMIRTNLHSANMFAVDLRDADLSNAILDQVDLRGSSMRCTNLTHASLIEADLRAGRL
jgi:uncharacterized protein YjbI with pentapeptide repeats